MKLRKILFIFLISLFLENTSTAEIPHFVDFKYILNESEAGKKAQSFLKKKLNDGVKKIQKR